MFNKFNKIEKMSLKKFKKYNKRLPLIINSEDEEAKIYCLIFMYVVSLSLSTVLLAYSVNFFSSAYGENLKILGVIPLLFSMLIIYFITFGWRKIFRNYIIKNYLEFKMYSAYLDIVNNKTINLREITKNLNSEYLNKILSSEKLERHIKYKKYLEKTLKKNKDLTLFENYKFVLTEKTISCIEYLFIVEKIKDIDDEIILLKADNKKYNSNKEAKQLQEKTISISLVKLEANKSAYQEELHTLSELISKLEIQESNIEYNIHKKYLEETNYNDNNNKSRLELLKALEHIDNQNKAIASTDLIFKTN